MYTRARPPHGGRRRPPATTARDRRPATDEISRNFDRGSAV